MFCRETKVTSLKIQILCPQILIFQFFERPYVLWELLAPSNNMAEVAIDAHLLLGKEVAR